MKKFHVALVLAVVAATALLFSCASSKFVTASGPEAELTKMVKAINKAGGVAVVATGVDMSGREDLAVTKAVLDGRTQVAQIFETNINNLQKKFVEEIGATKSAEINETFSSATKAITKATLNGSMALSDPITKTEGNKITVKVVVGVEPKVMNSSLLGELKNSNAALYERFRASQAFDELNKEMENYDSSGSK